MHRATRSRRSGRYCLPVPIGDQRHVKFALASDCDIERGGRAHRTHDD